jgi:sRNA-binding carbon storage regulator CsrA
MLVLTRHRQEVIYLDFSKMTDAQLLALRASDPIKMTIVEVVGDKVRIGFDAPREIKIDRKEVSDRKPKSGDDTVN